MVNLWFPKKPLLWPLRKFASGYLKIFLYLGLDPGPELNFGDTDTLLSSNHPFPEPGHRAEPSAISPVSLTEKDWLVSQDHDTALLCTTICPSSPLKYACQV